jgi:hypothetical protein
MATNGSFYQLGLAYGTAETGLGNVPASVTPTPAPSSFYQAGAAYTAIGNTDALTASLVTTLALTQAAATAAALSASQAAASATALRTIYFSAYMTTASQATTTGVFNKVLINAELADPNSLYDSVTNFRFQPTVAGYYRIHAQVQGLSTGGTLSEVDVDIYKNGATWSRTINLATGGATSAVIDDIVQFNGTTDYIEIFGLVAGTGTLSFLGGTGPRRTWVQAQYIGT